MLNNKLSGTYGATGDLGQGLCQPHCPKESNVDGSHLAPLGLGSETTLGAAALVVRAWPRRSQGRCQSSRQKDFASRLTAGISTIHTDRCHPSPSAFTLETQTAPPAFLLRGGLKYSLKIDNEVIILFS